MLNHNVCESTLTMLSESTDDAVCESTSMLFLNPHLVLLSVNLQTDHACESTSAMFSVNQLTDHAGYSSLQYRLRRIPRFAVMNMEDGNLQYESPHFTYVVAHVLMVKIFFLFS